MENDANMVGLRADLRARPAAVPRLRPPGQGFRPAEARIASQRWPTPVARTEPPIGW